MLDRQFVLGLVFVGLIGLVIAGTIAQYRGAFDSTVPVTVRADRAGLTLGGGAPVKLRGVEIGRVASVTPVDGDVTIELELDQDKVADVPADVTAQIVPPTAFGAKYVQLSARTGTSAEPIAAGAEIDADRVTVEVNEAFTNLTTVLDAARPNEVNHALTALAGAVDGRGDEIGRLITQVDGYLTSFNPSLRTLATDLRTSDDVLDTYADALPDLLDTADSASTTSDTLVAQSASLRAFLLSLRSFSDESRQLVDDTRVDLRSTLAQLAPVTSVLARYSPELPCVVLGLASANGLAEAAVGGTNPGITTITRFVPADRPYTYPDNLPVVGDTRGPACYGLPYIDAEEGSRPMPWFQTGANPYVGPDPTPQEDLETTLFGVLAGVGNLP